MPMITLEVRDRGKVIPLLEAALQKQAAHIELGLAKTQKRVEAFEQKYGCKLDEVDREAPYIDPLERVEWEGECDMLQRLGMEKEMLRTIRICG